MGGTPVRRPARLNTGSSRTFALASLVGLASACTYPPTEILVTIDTDAPRDRTLVVHATVSAASTTDGGATRTWSRGGSAGDIDFPASFAITPGEGPRDGIVTLTLDARLERGAGGEPPILFQRVARFRFTPRQPGALPLFLTVSCGRLTTGCTSVPADQCTVSAQCAEQGRTCGDDANCVSVEVQPTPVMVGSNVLDGGTDIRDATADSSPPLDATDADDATAADTTPPPDGIVPTDTGPSDGITGDGRCTCQGRSCGDDGCGTSCGTCPTGFQCTANQCVCVPSCAGAMCGPDGCGGMCGDCAIATCNHAGTCVSPLGCTGDCTGRVCGTDGCVMMCGSACPAGQICTAAGQCRCIPNCSMRQCGDDGCGGSCGRCDSGLTCNMSNGLCM